MDGNENTRNVAAQMLDHEDALRRELGREGAYHVVVEGGYHEFALTDKEADYLAVLLVNRGIEGLKEHAS